MTEIISRDIREQIEHLRRHHGQSATLLIDPLERRKDSATPAEREIIGEALAAHQRSIEKQPEDMKPYRG